MERIALLALKRGVLPSKTDARMWFEVAGPIEITGPDKKLMDEWSNIYARDPHSKADSFAVSING